MKNILRQNLAFLLPYLIFLIISGAFLVTYSKGEAHLILNQCRFEFCDYFFWLATYIGDGIAVVILVIVMGFVKLGYAAFLAVSNICSALITQILKHTIFANQVRPAKYFEGVAELKLIPWVENYFYNSFPSGHTTAAFTTFFCLALITGNKPMKFLLFAVALTIGFSRVYLSQHFLNDVYAGSLIGVITSMLFYGLVFQSDKFKRLTWPNRSLLRK